MKTNLQKILFFVGSFVMATFFYTNLFATECYSQLQVSFFEKSIVQQGLGIYNIPQGLWEPITQTLLLKSQEVPTRMKRVTKNMVPNPTDYPMQKAFVAKILQQVLKDVFYETMNKYNVNERPTADFIFDYIFSRQLSKFVECFGNDVRTLSTSFE